MSHIMSLKLNSLLLFDFYKISRLFVNKNFTIIHATNRYLNTPSVFTGSDHDFGDRRFIKRNTKLNLREEVKRIHVYTI